MKVKSTLILLATLFSLLSTRSTASTINNQFAYADSTELFLNRGKELAKKGLFEQAIVAFSHVIDHTQKNYEAYMNRAFAFESLKHYPDAIKDFGYIVKNAPENDFLQVAARQHRARMWLLLGIKETPSKDAAGVKSDKAQQFEMNDKDLLDNDLLQPVKND